MLPGIKGHRSRSSHIQNSPVLKRRHEGEVYATTKLQALSEERTDSIIDGSIMKRGSTDSVKTNGSTSEENDAGSKYLLVDDDHFGSSVFPPSRVERKMSDESLPSNQETTKEYAMSQQSVAKTTSGSSLDSGLLSLHTQHTDGDIHTESRVQLPAEGLAIINMVTW